MVNHEHIIHRINEELGMSPNAGIGTIAGDVHSGDSSTLGKPVTKDGEKQEQKPRNRDQEERLEIKIGDAILQAASGLAKSPAVEEIIRQAQELKRIHGVS